MSTAVIEVRGVSKSYQLGGIGMTTLKEEIARAWSRVRNPRRRPAATPATFWALRDVSFDVEAGSVVGIIGRNGAGKSTLLKILSRITPPATGEVTLRGRVASLLEVGTGFHPDLSGRENVFLNGAILGMTRAEIRKKFDEIVAFAEVDRFIDTPVKRYSSGMYVRLAFAVAAHLEPEILIVDEVLAVGDAAFQKKCLGKIGAVGREGRTVLFVSHNLLAVRSLCQRALLLEGGRVIADGSSDAVARQYLDSGLLRSQIALADRQDRTGSGTVRFVSVAFRDRFGADVPAFHCGDDAVLALGFDNRTGRDLRQVHVGVGIDNSLGQRVTQLNSLFAPGTPEVIAADATSIEVRVDRLPLVPGRYALTLYFAVGGETTDWIENAATFDVEPGDYFGTGKLYSDSGDFLVDHRFAVHAELLT